MKALIKKSRRIASVALLLVVLPFAQAQAQHDIRGITGPNFNLYAFPFNMNLPDGSSVYMWGFGDMDGGSGATHPEGNGYNLPQYPAPTLIVDEGDTVTISLKNYGVPQPVSIVITGHNVAASCAGTCTDGLVTTAVTPADDTVTYSFVATDPGTYVYHSLDGSNPGLQAEMGLQGVIIVRPADGSRTAYGTPSGTGYDQEFLYLLTEIDPDIHQQMERGHKEHFTHSDRAAKIWFVNGRVFPDLFQGDYNTLYPHQPYQALALAHPGDEVLVREVNAGHDSHPFHHHGENLRFLARDGRILSSDGVVADLGRSDNTLNSAPKQAVDMLWTWTGKDLNWDIYGPTDDSGPFPDHVCIDNDGDGFGDAPDSTFDHEYCADHGKNLYDLVTLPGPQDLTLGGWWSGSPFLGDTGDLPPGEGGLNPFGGYFLVWHSHAEKELTTFDIFPGGSLSSVVVVPPGAPIQ
jgi:hypothetical protein